MQREAYYKNRTLADLTFYFAFLALITEWWRHYKI